MVPALMAQQSGSTVESGPSFRSGLAPGDTVEVHFLDFQDAGDLHQTISPSGTLFVPYVGQLKVEGLMPDEAEAAIVTALKDKNVVKDPQVSLSVITARNLSVMVFGEVTQPHPVPVYSPTPLSFVLSQVGGFTAMASFHVLITHADNSAPTDVEIDHSLANPRGLNAMVRPGDLVAVVRAGSFFALGELNHPGIFPLTGVQHMTLLQAMAIAGGPMADATLSKVHILRTQPNGTRQDLLVDYEKIRDGKEADPLIHSDDIIIVLRSNTRLLINSWINQSLFLLLIAQGSGLTF